MDVFGVAADWLEHGRPGASALEAEREVFGVPLWGEPEGCRAYGRQDGADYRLSIVGGHGGVAYVLVGVDGGWLR